MTVTEKFSNLEFKEKVLILICGLVVVWCVGYFYIIDPQVQKYVEQTNVVEEKKGSTTNLHRQLEFLKNTVPDEKARYNKEIEEKKNKLEMLSAQVNSESRKALLSDINLLTHELILKAHSLDIKKLETRELKDRDATLPNYSKQQINTVIKGDYLRLASFLNNLKMSEHIFMLDEYSLDATAHPDIYLHLKINTYLEDVK